MRAPEATTLVAERDELLDLLLSDAGLSAAGPPLVPRPVGVPPPLSFAQRRLWLLDRMAPGSPAYNIAVAVRLEGALDRQALARSLTAIVARHESLRTVFPERDGEPVQRVLSPEPLALPLVEAPAVGEPQAWAEERVVAEARRPFDLAQGPLLRCLLLRLAPLLHVLVATAHHIVSDGWSMGILTEELTTLYAATTAGRPPALPPLPLQYADYALWQRAMLVGDVRAGQLAYWRRRLAGELMPLALPQARPRPPVQTFAGASLGIALPPLLTAALRDLGQRVGATLFSTLLASWAGLLHRYTGRTDLVVGTPVAGRNRPETERLIGFFVNALALRVDLTGEPATLDLLARVQAATLDAFAHQDVPFEEVVEAVQPVRSAGHSPLFQTLLVLDNVTIAMPKLSGLRLTRLAIDNRTAKFDLTLKVEEQPDGGLAARLEYATDLFDRAAMVRLAGHWTTLLAGMVQAPAVRFGSLPLLTTVEREEIAARWSPPRIAAAVAVDAAVLVHQRFAAQVDRVPQAPAVADEEERLSYAELNERANRLAHHLLALGIEPETRVALLLERSVGFVGAVLAVLKTGAAYVPLDPEQPAARLAEMLVDAEPTAVITVSRWIEKLPRVLASHLVLLDDDAGEIALASSRDPAPAAQAEHPAYVIYTSGSSGVPKGVVVPHSAFANYVAGVVDRFDLAACAHFALVSTPAADLGHTVLFPALATGGCLHLPARRVTIDTEALGELATREGIDCMKITPSHLAALLRGREPQRLLPRSRLILGGEPLARELVAQVAALAPGCRVANHYGPTEATVGAIIHDLSTAEEAEGPAGVWVPLGRPLDGVRVYLLDAGLEPVPEAVRGEVFLAGAGLARGYLNDPAKTAAAFLPDPFAGEPGDRMYRTGDMARRLATGELEIAGRVDRQVKIRGYRVEPGEVEAALERHPDVARAVVVARGQAGSAWRLVAYVVGRDGPPPQDEELRRHLVERLPAPMVPALFVPLPALPLTANGKLDRSALPDPDAAAPPANAEVASTPVEEVLCAIWARVLDVRRVEPHDNFFDLGGHSVLATQVMARIQETFRLELPVLSLFELPTPAGLARRIDLSLMDAQALQIPALLPAPRNEPNPPLSFAQQRLWFLYQLEPESPAYNMAGKVEIRGALDVPALGRSFSEIVRRHAVLRTTFPKVGGWPAQRVAAAAAAAFPQLDLASLPPAAGRAEAERLARAEARRPFDLGTDPLLRVVLLRLEREEHLLLLNLHHIAADGWSVGVILRELSLLYEAFSQDRPSPLPELALQYSDFALWQRQWLRGEVLAAQLDYWRRRLAGLPPALPLPTDHPHSPLQTSRGARLPFAIPGALAERLQVLSRAQDVTFFMTLLAVWETLLYRYTGQADFAVGTPIAGRNRSELEELVGFFVNTLVMRADFAASPTFGGLLGRVREAALGAYAHQDLPFEKLVEALEVKRDLARPPLFQTLFVWQNVPTPLARLSGLALVPLESDTETAKFELTLALQEMKGSLLGSMEYNSRLFEAATARRLAGHFTVLLAAIVEPGGEARRLGELPLLTPPERAQLVAWNDTGRPMPAESRLDQLIAAQCARTPAALAVVSEDGELSYGELDVRAGRLAGRLQALGVGPEVVVGVCLERTPALVVALLAVLKAGGAYLPLDPAYPAERLAFMLADAAALLLVSEPELAATLPPTAARVVLLDAAESMTAAAATSAATPDNLAYVIYTSGSTGKPKGVQITHRALVNCLISLRGEPGLAAGDVLAAVTSLSFDIAGLEIFLPLLAGARCVLVPRAVASDGRRLAALLAEVGATVLQATPSTWQLLAEVGWHGDLKALVGGEALPPALAAELAQRTAEAWNVFGPTETTIWSTVARLAPGERVTIGRPIANTSVSLLDAFLQPVPVGVPGSLYIGGCGLARGYCGQPGLTAERFVPDPAGAEAGGRLYATGDLARYLPDGRLEFLGRADHQVKVRGVRLELGEIEAAVVRHPAVSQAAVAARAEEGYVRLVVYLVPRPGCAVSFGELREHLALILPEAMLPSALVTLGALPLTANGKLDRRALPAPEAVRPELSELAGPRNAVERSLCELWAEALPVDRVGIHDDFFELGGNSLLAVRLMALIELRLGIELPLSSLFRGATVARLAQLLEEPAGDALWSPLVAIQPSGALPPFFCVHPNGGDVLCYKTLARLLGSDQPFYGLQARGLDGRRRPLRRMAEIAGDYLTALRAVQPRGPYRLGGWSFGGVVAFEMAQQLARQGEEVALLAILDSLAPIAARPRGEAELGREHWASWFMLIGREFEVVFDQVLNMSHEELAALPPEVQLETFIARLKQVSFLPAAAGLGTGSGFWRVHEANTVAMWDYAAQAVPYEHPITLLSSAERLIVADSWAPARHDAPDLGWSALAAGDLEVEIVPGNHNMLLRQPVVEVVAAKLRGCLARVAGRRP